MSQTGLEMWLHGRALATMRGTLNWIPSTAKQNNLQNTRKQVAAQAQKEEIPWLTLNWPSDPDWPLPFPGELALHSPSQPQEAPLPQVCSHPPPQEPGCL
jgi:hypothetical protein